MVIISAFRQGKGRAVILRQVCVPSVMYPRLFPGVMPRPGQLAVSITVMCSCVLNVCRVILVCSPGLGPVYYHSSNLPSPLNEWTRPEVLLQSSYTDLWNGKT